MPPTFSAELRFRGVSRWFVAVGLLAAFVVAPISASAQAGTEAAPFCGVGEAPHFAFGFAALKSAIGDAMGDPIECEHPNSANGDTLQQTSTGLAIYRHSTNSPEFTDGWNHWMLADSGLVAWTGDAVYVAPGVVAAPEWGAPQTQAQQAQPTVLTPSPASPPSPPSHTSPAPIPAQAAATVPSSPATAPATVIGMRCVDVGGGPCMNSSFELADTLTMLSHTSTAGPLLRTAAKAGYIVHFGDLPVDVMGLMRPSAHDITLSNVLKPYPTVDRAPVLAHELQHVTDWMNQGVALDTTSGCLGTETSAFHTEALAWLELEGGHLPNASNDLEREYNLIYQAITSDPVGFAGRLKVVYHDQCSGN